MTYSLTSWPRGMALIIDNEDFESLPPRRGSHIDSDCLARCLLHLLLSSACVLQALQGARLLGRHQEEPQEGLPRVRALQLCH